MPITTTAPRGKRARIPVAVRSSTPERLRHRVRDAGDSLPAELRQLLLDAAAEIEGSAHAFAELVDQKQALQRALALTESNLRAARLDHADDARHAGRATDTDEPRLCRADGGGTRGADGHETRDSLTGGRAPSRPPRSPS
ncbi:hypothetical protein WK62_31080 [Burkholderia ubonensis]|nr:hypothetical protein WK62_31080 [Burkholderia ubonensis]